jgi:hypothetical protein
MTWKKRRSSLDYAALGRKGGPARMAALTPQQRSELARTAAIARWKQATAEERSVAGRRAVMVRWMKAKGKKPRRSLRQT